MDDLISRQAAMDLHCELCADSEKCICEYCPDVLAFEALQAAEPRKGKWEVWCHGRQENDLYVFSYSCSVCGFPGDKTDYCPNCGARMEESE